MFQVVCSFNAQARSPSSYASTRLSSYASTSPGQRGCRGGAIFHDKAKNIRDKMRYSNVSNNMMILGNCEQQFKFKYSSHGRQVAHMTDTTWHQSWQSTPTPPPPTRSCWIHPWLSLLERSTRIAGRQVRSRGSIVAFFTTAPAWWSKFIDVQFPSTKPFNNL